MPSERMQLTITKLHDPFPLLVGEKKLPKYIFLAKQKGKDEELSYFTFKQYLESSLKVGETIDAEVDTTKREVGENTYTDRKVVQIYQGGQPVSQSQQQGGKAWQPRSSPEERASIEAQTAVKAVVELLVAKVMSPANPLAQAVGLWAAERLGIPKQDMIDLWGKDVPGPENQPKGDMPEKVKAITPPAPTEATKAPGREVVPPQTVKATATSPGPGVKHATIPASEAQLRVIRAGLKALEWPEEDFCKRRNIPNLTGLTALQANEQLDYLNKGEKPVV